MKTKNIILGVILAVLGIVMIAIPDTCIKAVVVIVGAAAVAFSVYNLLVIYKQSEDAAFKKTLLIKSIVTFIVGLVSVICPFVLINTVEAIFKIFSFILAIYLILYAGVSVYSSAKLRTAFPEESKKLIFEALIFIAIAILLILIPIEQFGQAFVRIVGLAGLIVGIVMVAVEIVINKRTATSQAAEADITEKMDQQAQAETSTSSDEQ